MILSIIHNNGNIIRELLGVSSGDRVTFVVENGNVRLINSAVYAMQMLQSQMEREASNSGLTSEDAISQDSAFAFLQK